MANKLRSKDFKKLNIFSNTTISIAMSILNRYYKHNSKAEKLAVMKDVVEQPENFISDPILGHIAELLVDDPEEEKLETALDEYDKPLTSFGRPLIKSNAYQQMKTALKLPVVERAALMPDSHLGYGIPIGGVLATKDTVIPFAVGMDIGCRMSLTIYDVNDRYLKMHDHKFKQSLMNHTAFGLSKTIEYKQEHSFLDRDVFHATALLKTLKSKAARQLGSSGSGNHFVEWGMVELEEHGLEGITPGVYVGLLAHSGSRGFGASIARHYTDLAKEQSNLPSNMRHLAWLDLKEDAGKEYWMSMNLAGDFAIACHDQIHKNVARDLGLKPLAKIQNHHNFAWKEMIGGEEMIVHRKGATPAHKGELGIIPGSMTDPGFIVKGLGNEQSLNSASHGAGRKHSRKETAHRFTNSEMRKHLKQNRIHLIGGSIDESPFAYKKLEQVMSFQRELVKPIGKFHPRIVRMNRR